MNIEGTCYPTFVYDVGNLVDVAAAEAQITELKSRVILKHKRAVRRDWVPSWAPLRFTQTGQALQLNGWATAETVDVVLYEFGAAAVSYSVPVTGPLETLVELSDLLYDNLTLLEDSRNRVTEVVRTLSAAIERPAVDELVEDYAIFELKLPSPASEISKLWTDHASTVARALRGERRPLSSEEISDAVSQRASYGPDDVALIDWHAAILVGDDMSDERALLEFATVELLELRYLDAQLDRGLDQAYLALSRRRSRFHFPSNPSHRLLHRFGHQQADNALLFEGVTNALKLVGDQYLARLYRVASARFHLKQWDETIDRKLQTLDSIYQKLADRASGTRMEVLEWIIIILIAISIAIYFVPLPGS